MDLSIIIAHYDPGNYSKCIQSFHRTLKTINEQKDDISIEIIIADDGSIANNDLVEISNSQINQQGRIIYCTSNETLDSWTTERNYTYSDLRYWLYLPKLKSVMSKARLGNAAIALASAENILFLDDDNYFITNNSIKMIMNLLKEYQLVFGQIRDSNGRFRSYKSHRVQGTTFAVKKEIIKKIGGFGNWTEIVSSGVDSDIWWKLYYHFKEKHNLKACYTSKVQTFDSCSKRWKPHIKYFFRHQAVKKEFFKIHGCINYKNATKNPSRNKLNWIQDLT